MLSYIKLKTAIVYYAKEKSYFILESIGLVWY